MRIRWLGFLIMATAAACSRGPREVKIALALPLTGDIAALGQGIQRAAQLAMEESSSRFTAHKVVLVPFDDRSDPKEAVSVANRIVADPDVVAVIGHFNSGCSIPASRVYAQAGLPMVTPGSSNPELTRQQLSPNWRWARNVFRANTTDDVQGSYAAGVAAGLLPKGAAAVIHDKTAYGQGIAEEFQKHWVASGGSVRSFDGVQSGDKDFKALLTRLKAKKPGLLFYGGTYTEGALILRQAREVGMKVPFMTGENSYDPDFLRIAGSAAEGAYITYLGRPPELLESARVFVDKFRLRYPGVDIRAYDHYGYEITHMLLESLAASGPDRAKILEFLAGMTYTGVLGTTSFDEKGDTQNKTITLFRVKEGRFVPHEVEVPR